MNAALPANVPDSQESVITSAMLEACASSPWSMKDGSEVSWQEAAGCAAAGALNNAPVPSTSPRESVAAAAARRASDLVASLPMLLSSLIGSQCTTAGGLIEKVVA